MYDGSLLKRKIVSMEEDLIFDRYDNSLQVLRCRYICTQYCKSGSVENHFSS